MSLSTRGTCLCLLRVRTCLLQPRPSRFNFARSPVLCPPSRLCHRLLPELRPRSRQPLPLLLPLALPLAVASAGPTRLLRCPCSLPFLPGLPPTVRLLLVPLASLPLRPALPPPCLTPPSWVRSLVSCPLPLLLVAGLGGEAPLSALLLLVGVSVLPPPPPPLLLHGLLLLLPGLLRAVV
jgi:hypothetical protein